MMNAYSTRTMAMSVIMVDVRCMNGNSWNGRIENGLSKSANEEREGSAGRKITLSV